MYYDEEIPAGYQEADLLQAEYERESNQIWAERKMATRPEDSCLLHG